MQRLLSCSSRQTRKSSFANSSALDAPGGYLIQFPGFRTVFGVAWPVRACCLRRDEPSQRATSPPDRLFLRRRYWPRLMGHLYVIIPMRRLNSSTNATGFGNKFAKRSSPPTSKWSAGHWRRSSSMSRRMITLSAMKIPYPTSWRRRRRSRFSNSPILCPAEHYHS